MAALTKTQICNLALGRLGASQLTDVDTDASVESIQCLLHYDATLNALLRAHPWRFASLWVELVLDAAADSGTSTDDTNTTVKLYDTDQAWTDDEWDGYYVWITGGTGENQIREIASNQEEYLVPSVAFTTVPDATSTYEIWKNYPPYPWDYQFDMPSDFKRLNQTHSREIRYEIDAGLLKTNESSLAINYVQTVTVLDSDPLFLEVFTVALAAKLCMPLLRDKTWQRELEAELREVVSRARMVNLNESKSKPTTQTWLEGRQ